MDRRGFLKGTVAALVAARFGKLPTPAEAAPLVETAEAPALVGSSKLLYSARAASAPRCPRSTRCRCCGLRANGWTRSS